MADFKIEELIVLDIDL